MKAYGYGDEATWPAPWHPSDPRNNEPDERSSRDDSAPCEAAHACGGDPARCAKCHAIPDDPDNTPDEY